MHGTGHRLTAAAAWVAASHQAGSPAWQVAGGALIAAAFSAGPTSPDIDNTRLWKRLDRWIPDELLGDGGPLGHRELLHWWGLPAAIALVLHVAGGPWYAWAAVVGWSSHLVGDFLCGQPGYGTPIGIPIGPWHVHVGLGLKSGGVVERWVITPAVAAVTAWWVAGAPGAAEIVAFGR